MKKKNTYNQNNFRKLQNDVTLLVIHILYLQEKIVQTLFLLFKFLFLKDVTFYF